MLLGGTVTGAYSSVAEWERLLIASRFKAVTAPFTCRTPREEISRYLDAVNRNGVTIAEIGVWKNPFDPDPDKAAQAVAFAKGQLALADELGIPCCVNIVGTSSPNGWDAADKSNYAPETYQAAVKCIRDILDSVNPKRAFYCIEPMPWMIPDGPKEYLQLIRDVDRPQFAAHMDFVNMINCPRRFFLAEEFLEECFGLLGPYIKSTHIKDSRMDPNQFTAHLWECPPGQGQLDYEMVLRVIDRHMPKDAPILLEHMSTFQEYAAAYDYVAEKAKAARVFIG